MKLTENQKKTIKSKLKPLVMEVLNEASTRYYSSELGIIDSSGQYAPWVQFGSEGKRTKHINLTTESIPVLITWLKKVMKERAKVEDAV